MDFTTKTIDELDELLAWIADRRRYRIKCGLPSEGHDDYVEQCVLAELNRR